MATRRATATPRRRAAAVKPVISQPQAEAVAKLFIESTACYRTAGRVSKQRMLSALSNHSMLALDDDIVKNLKTGLRELRAAVELGDARVTLQKRRNIMQCETQTLAQNVALLRALLSSSFNDECLDALKLEINEIKPDKIVKGILALNDEFPSVVFLPVKKQLIVTTPSITLDDDGSDAIEFGQYRIIFSFRGADGFTYAIEPVDEKIIIDAHCHPHVEDGSLCEGSAEPMLRAASTRASLQDFVLIVYNTLNTYGGSAYLDLSAWHASKCGACQGRTDDEDDYHCDKCDQIFCADCCSSCHVCDELYCPKCLKAENKCQVCERTTCGSPDCLDKCAKCRGLACTSCCEDLGNCSACGDGIECDCSSITCACCEATICTGCSIKCPKCQKLVCCENEECYKDGKCKQCQISDAGKPQQGRNTRRRAPANP